jgi:hypothetical protein
MWVERPGMVERAKEGESGTSLISGLLIHSNSYSDSDCIRTIKHQKPALSILSSFIIHHIFLSSKKHICRNSLKR